MKTLNPILLAAILVVSAAYSRADQEQDLISILTSGANAVEKCEACKKLRLVATAKSLPALAAVLADDRVSQAARYVLEGMALPEAGVVLRDALAASAGAIKLGIIDSLGWRRDLAAVPTLVRLLSDPEVA